MKKYVPYEKLSKKKRRQMDQIRRGTWGEINPVTRKSENPKAYNRRKCPRWPDDGFAGTFFACVELRKIIIDFQ